MDFQQIFLNKEFQVSETVTCETVKEYTFKLNRGVFEGKKGEKQQDARK